MTKPLPVSAQRPLSPDAHTSAHVTGELQSLPNDGQLIPPEHDFLPGDIVGGRHLIQHFLDDSPLATYYVAQHLSVASLAYVFKVLKSELMEYPELVEQFRVEAHSVARLRDPHSVRITDMGTLDDGRPFHCREYVRGVNIAEYMEKRGPLSGALVYRTALGALSALAEAHSLGIVHRDIRPRGLLFAEDKTSGEVMCRVLDFGSAYVGGREKTGDDYPATNPSLLMCAPQYAAPDLLQGRITPSVDTYAIGLTLAELLEGKPLVPTGNFFKIAQLQLAAQEWELGPLAATSPLAPIIRRAIRKNHAERYEDASEMLDDLMRHASIFPAPGEMDWSHFKPLTPVFKSIQLAPPYSRQPSLYTPAESLAAAQAPTSDALASNVPTEVRLAPPKAQALARRQDNDLFDLIDQISSGNLTPHIVDKARANIEPTSTSPRELPRVHIPSDDLGTAVLKRKTLIHQVSEDLHTLPTPIARRVPSPLELQGRDETSGDHPNEGLDAAPAPTKPAPEVPLSARPTPDELTPTEPVPTTPAQAERDREPVDAAPHDETPTLRISKDEKGRLRKLKKAENAQNLALLTRGIIIAFLLVFIIFMIASNIKQ